MPLARLPRDRRTRFALASGAVVAFVAGVAGVLLYDSDEDERPTRVLPGTIERGDEDEQPAGPSSTTSPPRQPERSEDATRPRHVVPSTVPADCSRDVTAVLQAWLDKVPDGALAVLRSSACYRLDGSLHLERRHDFLLDGNGATLRAVAKGDRDRRHVWVRAGRDLVIRDLTVQGAHERAGAHPESYDGTRAFQHAFALEGVHGVRLERVRARQVFGDFVYVGGSPARDGGVRWSEDVVIVDSEFRGSGRQGIAVTAADGVTIERNRIAEVGRSLFDLEPLPGGGARRITISKNRTGAARNFWLASKGEGSEVGDVRVTDNTMLSPTGGLVLVAGPPGERRGPFVFEGNLLRTSGNRSDEGARGALFFGRCEDVKVRDNDMRLPRGRGMPAVELRGSRRVVVEDNRLVNAGAEVVGGQS